jgi:hypothetical protein
MRAVRFGNHEPWSGTLPDGAKTLPFRHLELTSTIYIHNTSKVYSDRIDAREQFYNFTFIYRRSGEGVSRHEKKTGKYFLVRAIPKCPGPRPTNGKYAYK